MSNVELKQQLDEKQLAIVQSELEQKKLSTVVGYILWFFLGQLGAHRFYTRKIGSAVAMLVLEILGWLTAIILIGFVFLAIVGVWWIVDAFLLHGVINEKNQQIEKEIVQQVAK